MFALYNAIPLMFFLGAACAGEPNNNSTTDLEIAQFNFTEINGTRLADMLFNCSGLPDGVYHSGEWCADSEFFACAGGSTFYLQCQGDRFVDKYLECIDKMFCQPPLVVSPDEAIVYVRKSIGPLPRRYPVRRRQFIDTAAGVGQSILGFSKTASMLCDQIIVCTDEPETTSPTVAETTPPAVTEPVSTETGVDGHSPYDGNGTCSAAQTASALDTLAVIQREYIQPIERISEQLEHAGSICEWTPSVLHESTTSRPVNQKLNRADDGDAGEDADFMDEKLERNCSICKSIARTAVHVIDAAKSLTYMASTQLCNATEEKTKCLRITKSVMAPLTLALRDIFDEAFICKSTNHLCISEEEKMKYETLPGGWFNLGRQSCELCVDNLKWTQRLYAKFLDISTAFCLNEPACEAYRKAVHITKELSHRNDTELLAFCQAGLCFKTGDDLPEDSQCRTTKNGPWITCRDLLCQFPEDDARKCSKKSGKITTPQCLKLDETAMLQCKSLLCSEDADKEYVRCGGF